MRYSFKQEQSIYEILDDDKPIAYTQYRSMAEIIINALNQVNEISFNSVLADVKLFSHCDKCISDFWSSCTERDKCRFNE